MLSLALDIKAVVEVIRANTNKQILGFSGATSELKALRAFLRNPCGFLLTTIELFSGMEATSVIVLLDSGGGHQDYIPNTYFEWFTQGNY